MQSDDQLRRGSTVRRAFLAAVCGALALGIAPRARAQDAVSGDFTVQRFDPAPGPRNFITTRGARVDGKMDFTAGIFFNYGRKPFVLESCATRTDCSSPNPLAPEDVFVVRRVMTFDAIGTLTLIPPLQLGLKVPVTGVKGEGLARGDDPAVPAGSPDPEGLKTWGIGDIQLEGKLRLADPTAVAVPGLAVFATGPLGTLTAENQYVGDRTPTAGLRGIIDLASGPLGIGINLAGVYRGESHVGSSTIGPELRYGAAAAYRASKALRVVVDGFGAADFRSENAVSALEIDAALGVDIAPLSFLAGGGVGVLADIGVPTYRIFVGGSFDSGAIDRNLADQDDDQVPDDIDECPGVREDRDGDEDEDGCPE